MDGEIDLLDRGFPIEGHSDDLVKERFQVDGGVLVRDVLDILEIRGYPVKGKVANELRIERVDIVGGRRAEDGGETMAKKP